MTTPSKESACVKITNMPLLKSALEKWFLDAKKNKVAYRTFNLLTRTAKRYIYPQLGDYRLCDITQSLVQDFIDGIEAKTMAHKSKQVLNEFFDYCWKCNFVGKNPVKEIISPYKYPGKKKENLAILSAEKEGLLLKAASKHFFWHPFCFLILRAGVRPNELLALTWKDIDFDRSMVSLDKYVTRNNMVVHPGDTAQKAFHIRKHKFAARPIRISDDVIESLKKYKLFREVEQQRVRDLYSLTADNDLVFGNKYGGLINYSGAGHIFRKYLNRNGLAGVNVTFSMLRNTFKGNWRKTMEAASYEDESPFSDYFEEEPKPKTQQSGFEM